MATVKTRLIPSRSFFQALPHREAKSNIGRKLSWGGEKYNLNAAWSGESKLHTRNARSSTPSCAPESFCASPFCTPPPPYLPFIARYPSCTAQHMHTKYIKRPAPVPKYGVVYSRVVWGRKRRAPRLVRLREGLGCALLFHHDDTTLTLRLYAPPRSQNDQTVST